MIKTGDLSRFYLYPIVQFGDLQSKSGDVISYSRITELLLVNHN